MNPRPGDAVAFTLKFTGIFVRGHGRYATVRTKRGEYVIPKTDILHVLDPKPDPAEVVTKISCSKCWVSAGVMCIHLQTSRTLKHPHTERVEEFVTRKQAMKEIRKQVMKEMT